MFTQETGCGPTDGAAPPPYCSKWQPGFIGSGAELQPTLNVSLLPTAATVTHGDNDKYRSIYIRGRQGQDTTKYQEENYGSQGEKV